MEPTPFKEIVAPWPSTSQRGPGGHHDQRVLGMVSEADLLLKEEFPEPDKDILLWWTTRARLERERAAASVARDLMTVAVVCIVPEATVAEAARRMHTAGVKRLPVVERGAAWSGSSAGAGAGRPGPARAAAHRRGPLRTTGRRGA